VTNKEIGVRRLWRKEHIFAVGRMLRINGESYGEEESGEADRSTS